MLLRPLSLMSHFTPHVNLTHQKSPIEVHYSLRTAHTVTIFARLTERAVQVRMVYSNTDDLRA